MGWSLTLVASNITGNGSLALDAEYEAVVTNVNGTVPDWYGRTGSPGRMIFFEMGRIALARVDGPSFAPQRLCYTNQLFVPPARTVDRIFHYVGVGITLYVYGANWV